MTRKEYMKIVDKYDEFLGNVDSMRITLLDGIRKI